MKHKDISAIKQASKDLDLYIASTEDENLIKRAAIAKGIINAAIALSTTQKLLFRVKNRHRNRDLEPL